MFTTRGAVGVALMLTFAFETGFTNMQFLGLAADAAEVGDWTFSSLISSIQTDESRHAQIGGPLVTLLVENGKKAEAQQLVDVGIWRAWKLFSVLTGPIMDYYTPLEHRKQSFKEFMQEWIVAQFERSLLDLGLDRPWYWDLLMAEIETQHHGQHLGVWFWRPTVWWNPAAGVSPDERDWLEEKYPGWNDTWGKCWDVITDNLLDGHRRADLPGDAAGGLQHVPAADQHHAGTRMEGEGPSARPRGADLPLLLGSVPLVLRARTGQVRRAPVAHRPVPRRHDPADGPQWRPAVHGPRTGRDRRRRPRLRVGREGPRRPPTAGELSERNHRWHCSH